MCVGVSVLVAIAGISGWFVTWLGPEVDAL